MATPNRDYFADFRKNLADLKDTKDYKWDQIAEHTGIPEQTLKSYTNRKNPSRPTLDNLCAIADFFDVPLDYLVGRSVSKQKRTIAEIADYTGLSGYTVNALHFESDPVMRSLYKKLFHALIGELHSSGEELVNLLVEAATARAITNADLNHHRAMTGADRAEETNLSKAIEQTSDGLYTLPAYEVERVYIQDAEAIIHGCVCSVDDLVRDISRQFQSADDIKKMKGSIRFEVDEAEEDLEPWFDGELELRDDFKA